MWAGTASRSWRTRWDRGIRYGEGIDPEWVPAKYREANQELLDLVHAQSDAIDHYERTVEEIRLTVPPGADIPPELLDAFAAAGKTMSQLTKRFTTVATRLVALIGADSGTEEEGLWVAMMRHFVVVYQRRRGLVINMREFDDRSQAFDQRWAMDAEYQADPDVEIVVLSADSEEDLHKTHGRYFKSVADWRPKRTYPRDATADRQSMSVGRWSAQGQAMVPSPSGHRQVSMSNPAALRSRAVSPVLFHT